MKTQFKTFPGALVGHDDTEMILEHFISTETQDSGGDVMLAAGMKLRGKPVVLFQHGLDPKFGNEPIARVIDIHVGEHNGKKGLIAKTKYFDGSKLTPPDATGQRLYMKAKDGTMPNWSIGFNSIKEHPVKGGRIVDEWELHEYSQVAVGMNAEATTLATSAPELKFIIKADEIKPDPSAFSTETEFMKVCVPKMVSEGKDQEQAVAACLNIWKRKDEKGGPGSGRYPAGSDKDGAALPKDTPVGTPVRFKEPKEPGDADARFAVVEDRGDRVLVKDENSKEPIPPTFVYAKEELVIDKPETEKSETVPETKSESFAHKRAHKAIKAMHKEMMADLKAHGSRDNLMDVGAEKCAKEALEEFTDGAQPHVVKYIKAVRDMKDDTALTDGEDDNGDAEDKGYRASMNNLNKALKGMIKSIHGLRGNQAAVPDHEAEKCLTEHAITAEPHAVEFIKAWHEKCKTDAETERETKPTPDKPAASVPADDAENQKFFINKPPVSMVRLKENVPPPSLKLSLKSDVKKPEPTITPALIKELIASAQASMSDIMRAELRKAAGKVS
jgi:hypothetical protein